MATRSVSRTVVLGDLHGSLEAFQTILIRAGLLEGTSWRGGKAFLVQLGDVIDRGPDSIATYEFLAELQRRAPKGRGRVIRLLGNHEVSLLEGDYDLTDFSEAEAAAVAVRIRQDVMDGKVQAAFARNGWLFTHAGLHMNLLQSLRADMKASGKERFTPRRLASHLNQRFRSAVERGDFDDPIFAVGRARGGDAGTGGIFWADFDSEMKAPARAPRVHQVFGHTPEGYKGATFRRTSDGRRINIDIGIVEDHGGNLGYLEIQGREALAHYLSEGREVIETLGSAPLARKRKEKEPAPPDPGPVRAAS